MARNFFGLVFLGFLFKNLPSCEALLAKTNRGVATDPFKFNIAQFKGTTKIPNFRSGGRYLGAMPFFYTKK
jgi:hypothetical protein